MKILVWPDGSWADASITDDAYIKTFGYDYSTEEVPEYVEGDEIDRFAHCKANGKEYLG